MCSSLSQRIFVVVNIARIPLLNLFALCPIGRFLQVAVLLQQENHKPYSATIEDIFICECVIVLEIILGTQMRLGIRLISSYSA